MTAQPTGHVPWFPDPIRQRLANHMIEVRLPIADITP
jgi:hypothetical protein